MTFDKIFLKRDIELPVKSSIPYLKAGVPFTVVMENDDSVMISVAGIDRVVLKEDCLICCNQLGPFKGTTLTI